MPGFDTNMIHGGAAPDPTTGARQTPIYQTTAYVFKDADHAAKLFNLQAVGNIYSRLTNPTVDALRSRISILENGLVHGGIPASVCCSSGHAAQIMALFPLMSPGKNIVASTRLYGGSYQQFQGCIKKFGWACTFVDLDDLEAVEAACDENTMAIFCESIANPGGYITDLKAIAAIADRQKVPLICDNTTATPYLCNPIDHGATLVVHSCTKYLTGNGTTTGGCVVDSGKFNWAEVPGKYPSLTEPEPAYHGLVFSSAFGGLAFTFYSIGVTLRDLGMTMNPQGAHYTLCGIETLSLRMIKHVANAKVVAVWLENDPRVDFVTYAGLESSRYYSRMTEFCPRGAGALFTFAIKGGYEACVKLVDNLKIFSHVANLGDCRSLVIHSASTTHRQLSPEQQEAAGAGPNIVRLSIGIEDAADLIADLDQALSAATS